MSLDNDSGFHILGRLIGEIVMTTIAFRAASNREYQPALVAPATPPFLIKTALAKAFSMTEKVMESPGC